MNDHDKLEVLRKARDLLIGGWMQFDWFQEKSESFPDSKDCYCTMGAVAKVVEPDVDFDCLDGDSVGLDAFAPVLAPHAQAIDDIWGYPVTGATMQWGDIAKWNDTDGRTQDQVIDMFDRAIAELHLSLPHLEGQAS